ncbi:MAG: OsmC family protein [Cyclobacteriaceae bacterium]|nr:OsmC family protein [Cyclobacteriaceae bacterium]
MTKFSSEYLGQLRTSITHLQSGETITTDAPKDNQGEGKYFSPTDLVAAALGSCMVTIIGIKANSLNLKITSITWESEKIMDTNPRRISQVKLDINMEFEEITEKQKEQIVRAAESCPVAMSLHADLKQNVNFNFKNA